MTGTSPLSYILLNVVGGDGRGLKTPSLGGPPTTVPFILEAGVKASTLLKVEQVEEVVVALEAADPSARLPTPPSALRD